jgi:hypothetical protein
VLTHLSGDNVHLNSLIINRMAVVKRLKDPRACP